MFKKIILVCTGNICRSPMAEAMLRAQLPAIKRIGSVGVGAVVGAGPTEEAIAVMREHGYDISGHRARQATLPILGNADLILTLDQSHSNWINKRYPQLRGRVHKLLKWHENQDIEDPFMKSQGFFEETYAAMQMGIDDWLKRLA